ncbi:MAG: hypothetical protein LBE46_05230 [Wolbachia pipientis]|nr:hypothetical protein [Wolbachia pipientis]
MNYKQWKRMLSAVDKEEGLSKDNVIEKIKEKLKAENGEDEYKKWEEAGFDVNYLFEVESNVSFNVKMVLSFNLKMRISKIMHSLNLKIMVSHYYT